MPESDVATHTNGPRVGPSITDLLSDLNKYLSVALQNLKSQGPDLKQALQDDYHLPDPETLKLAARAVDLMHQIQLLLDPPVLILADHFLGISREEHLQVQKKKTVSLANTALFKGYVRSKCLSAAVDRGVADALEKGPLTIDELAEATKSREDRLDQVLRILSTCGIFHRDNTVESYSNTPASSLLRSGHRDQWHNWARLYGSQFYDIARGIPDSTRGEAARSAAQINYNTDDNMFSFFHARGWMPELHRTLGGGAAAQMPGILEDYPWHEVANELIVDIGCGSGAFLAGLLRRYGTIKGGLYDLPHVVEHIRPFFRSGGEYSDVANQIPEGNLSGGDFFESVPPSAVYTMKWCLHDWKDAQATEILKSIRRAVVTGPTSRLIVLESILSDDYSSRLSQYGNINMMMTADGQERTEGQWRGLAYDSGWKIDKIWDLRGAWVKALDFRPASDWSQS